MELGSSWDDRYRTVQRLWGTKPSPELEWILHYAPSTGTAIDLGCGEGQLACALAMRGYSVRAVDISGASIERTCRLATDLGLDVEARMCDIASMSLGEELFDVVVLDLVIQYLSIAGRSHILQAIKRCLRPSGVFYIRTFSPDDPTAGNTLTPSNIQLFQVEDIVDAVKPLRALRSVREYWLDSTHGTPHFHGTVSVIAQK